MKPVTSKTSQPNKSNAGTIRAGILFGPGGSTSGANPQDPCLYRNWSGRYMHGLTPLQVASGSTINEYKTSLQLPGSHLGIHRAATHLLFIKPCLM